MTDRYELTKLYHAKKIITTCWGKDCNLYNINGIWIAHSGIPDSYERLSHGICPRHYLVALSELRVITLDELLRDK